ncbi:MAG: O-antigen ligase family protein [Porticoccaceae bacterium]
MLPQSSEPALAPYLRLTVLMLLIWLPLPAGSNWPWAGGLYVAIVALVTLLWCAARLRRRALSVDELVLKLARDGAVAGASAAPVRAALPLLALLLSAQLWVLMQWWLGISVDPGRTFRYLLLGTAHCLLFWLVINLFSERRHLSVLVAVLVASGAAQAFWGAFMTLSGTEWLLFGPKEHYRGVVTGTFVNRNHLAGYLEMTLALAIGLMLALRDGRPFNWRNLLEWLLSPKAVLRLAIVMMVIALVMTQSRMGNTAFFASLLVVGGLYVLINRQNRVRNSLILASLIAIDLLVISHFFGLENLKNRLEQTHLQTLVVDGQVVQRRADRLDVAEYVVPQIAARPLTGHGAGAFEASFAQYAGADLQMDFDHAHNDYLQFLAEFGLLGSLPLGLFVLAALYQALRALWRRESYYRSGLGFAAAMGILALMIHSLTDFNHQIPANAATFVVLCAIAVLARHHRRDPTPAGREHRHRRGRAG